MHAHKPARPCSIFSCAKNVSGARPRLSGGSAGASTGPAFVVPLRREAVFGPRARNLNPALLVGADKVVLDTAALGAVPLAVLRKAVANLRETRAVIQEALDTLFGAY